MCARTGDIKRLINPQDVQATRSWRCASLRACPLPEGEATVLLRSQIKVGSIILIMIFRTILTVGLFRAQRFFFLARCRFLAFLPTTFARGGFAGLLPLVLRCAPAGDGELAFFLALDVSEDVARRTAAQIPIIV